MPTQEIPDDELDDLFRKASGEHVEEFDPEAWRRMEKLLDQEGGRGRAFPWWKGLLVLGLLLLGTLGIWYVTRPALDERGKVSLKENNQPVDPGLTQSKEVTKGQNQPAAPVEKPAVIPEEAATHQETTRSAGPANGSREVRRSKEEENRNKTNRNDRIIIRNPTSEEAENETASRRLPQPARAKQRSPTSVGPEANTTGLAIVPAEKKEQLSGERNRVTGKQNRESNSVEEHKLKAEQPRNEEPDPEILSSVPGTDPVQGNVAVFPENRLGTPEKGRKRIETAEMENADTQRAGQVIYDLLTGRSIAVVPSQPKSGEVPMPETKPYFIEQPPAAKPYRLSAALMLSPDLSSVGFFNAAMPGTNAGAKLEYRISNRLSVNVGLIHSVKIYSAQPEDYHPPYGTWSYGKKPSAIDAKCKILDIPLNLRFDVIRQPKYRLFIANGLSSYIMLSERYDYSYDTPNPHLIQSWTGRRTGSYKFSVYNISLGYERQFGKRLSWQAEPFLKLPLGGVGFGKVRLLSTGVFFTANYHLLR